MNGKALDAAGCWIGCGWCIHLGPYTNWKLFAVGEGQGVGTAFTFHTV